MSYDEIACTRLIPHPYIRMCECLMMRNRCACGNTWILAECDGTVCLWKHMDTHREQDAICEILKVNRTYAYSVSVA